MAATPFIVLDDADLDAASSGAVAGRFINCGQSCIASKRFLIAKSVADSFLDHFITKTKSLRIGDPLDAETDTGPMVREDALMTLDSQVRDAVRKGARVEVGGDRIQRRGHHYHPTILTWVKPEMRVIGEETFGPVAPVLTVKDDEEAVKFANQSKFGLGASVWGQDIRRGTPAWEFPKQARPSGMNLGIFGLSSLQRCCEGTLMGLSGPVDGIVMAASKVADSKVDSKGRILLPPALRGELHLESGDVVSFKRIRSGLVVVPAQKSGFISMFKRLLDSPPMRTGKPRNWSPSRMKKVWKSA